MLHVIRNEVDSGFVRRPMADFEYLYATVTPPTWILAITWIFEILTTLFLGHSFWEEDPFKDGFRGSRSRIASRLPRSNRRGW